MSWGLAGVIYYLVGLEFCEDLQDVISKGKLYPLVFVIGG